MDLEGCTIGLGEKALEQSLKLGQECQTLSVVNFRSLNYSHGKTWRIEDVACGKSSEFRSFSLLCLYQNPVQLSPTGKQMQTLSWVIPMTFFFYYYEINESLSLGPFLLLSIRRYLALEITLPILFLNFPIDMVAWTGSHWDPQMLFSHPFSTSTTGHSLPGTTQSARKIMSANMGHVATVPQANMPRVA